MPRKSSPFRWDEERHFLLRAELDTAYIPDTLTRHARRPTYDV